MTDQRIPRLMHFVPDDKFIDEAIMRFETCAPGQHDYAMYNRRNPAEVIYVNSLDKITYAPIGSPRYQEIITACRQGQYAALIMHSLPDYFEKLVAAVREHVRIAVLTWGHEIYGFMNLQEYMPETRAIRRSSQIQGRLGWLKAAYCTARQNLTTNPFFPLNRSLRAVLDVDYLGPVLDEDYIRFVSKFKRHRMPEMLEYSYVDIDTLAEMGQREMDDTCIMVGNSATPEGNHVDVFLRLKQLGIPNRIMVPLNYGQPKYGAIVRSRGCEIFGEQFYSIDTFLPFKKYVDELWHCRYVVMAHRRQQAVGNIIMMLWMGAKVFFAKGSPVYDFLIKRGGHVFLMEEATPEDFSTTLGVGDVAANRDLLHRVWGREQVLRRTRNVIATMTGR